MSTPRSPFALLIAVDKYASWHLGNLNFAVSDAERVKKYLQEELGVDASRILTLYNEAATRLRIIRQLQHLAESESIQRNDPIIIYYSGYPCQLEKPIGWDSAGDYIQALVPYDCMEESTDALQGLIIGVLLEQIANAKGNNITVILDCSNSGSLTMSESNASLRIGLDAGQLSSHVLLSACGADEQAYEDDVLGGGAFTISLLNTLSTFGHEKVTYKQLIQHLPLLPYQHPQCYGRNIDRIVFGSTTPALNGVWFAIRKLPSIKGQTYKVEAGAAHGVTAGARFAVYSSRTPASETTLLARIVASKVFPYWTEATVISGSLNADLTEAACIQTREGGQEDLRLHIKGKGSDNQKLQMVYHALNAARKPTCDILPEAPPHIALVKKYKAELSIFVQGRDVWVEVLDPLIKMHGLKRLQSPMPHDLSAATSFLRAAANYHRYLHRVQGVDDIRGHLRIELTKLKRHGWNSTKPEGENLIKDGIADIPANDGMIYGIKLTNNFDVDLYPSVFFFNSLDMSITSVYECPFAKAGMVDSPLRARSSLTIGYGSGGSPPFEFSLPQGQDINVSILRIFVSDRYVDMSRVAQSSPFGDPSDETSRGLSNGSVGTVDASRVSPSPPLVQTFRQDAGGSRSDEGIWGTTVVSVAQRRRLSG